MDFFFDKGKLLRSKKTKTIRAFFSPIDRLFGDYELRKMYPSRMEKYESLSQLLYRKKSNGEQFKISKQNVIDYLDSENFLLGLMISEVNHELRLDSFWISPETLVNIDSIEKEKENAFKASPQSLADEINNSISKTDSAEKKANIKFPILILEPTYLRQIVFEIEEYIDARIGQYKDGRYVVFLHPKRNESDMPIRIPRPPQEE
jgi:hypothetical protein